MNQKLVALAVGLFLGTNAMASGQELVVGCYNVNRDGIKEIEIVNNDGIGEVTTLFTDGTIHIEDLGEPASVQIESSFPLPSNGEVSRTLQWRHTGWAINSYDNGAVSHDYIDCE
jgi:hypothetical protein